MKPMGVLFSLTLFMLVGYGGITYPVEGAAEASAQTAPDNTGRNIRDRSGTTLTPGDQSESEADRNLTQQIRRAVVDDDSLSMMAKNIKIITVNGVVTLRGPVQNPEEKQIIEAKAQRIVRADQIDNQLEVKGH
jgi:osmotically-inducible protein OsmY